MPQSWEWYQQLWEDQDVVYPLSWICGQGAVTASLDAHTLSLTEFLLEPGRLYAIPFNQMKAMTVGWMGINVVRNTDANGAFVRLGIFENLSGTSSRPGRLVVDFGLIVVGRDRGVGTFWTDRRNCALEADKRYWAVLLTSGPVNGSISLAWARRHVRPFFGGQDLLPPPDC